MSAYVHENDHIDLIVSLAMRVNTTISAPTPANPLIHSIGLTTSTSETITPDDLGRVLLAQNVASVRDRYSDIDDTPEGVEYDEQVASYTHTPVTINDETFGGIAWAVAGLKAISSYEYQSCEDDGWKTSQAHQWTQTTADRLMHFLPGYQEADTWAWARAKVAVSR